MRKWWVGVTLNLKENIHKEQQQKKKKKNSHSRKQLFF